MLQEFFQVGRWKTIAVRKFASLCDFYKVTQVSNDAQLYNCFVCCKLIPAPPRRHVKKYKWNNEYIQYIQSISKRLWDIGAQQKTTVDLFTGISSTSMMVLPTGLSTGWAEVTQAPPKHARSPQWLKVIHRCIRCGDSVLDPGKGGFPWVSMGFNWNWPHATENDLTVDGRV